MKGRPPLIPRIEALEQQLHAQYQMLIALEKSVLALTDRHNYMTSDSYKPQFARWPDIKNGS